MTNDLAAEIRRRRPIVTKIVNGFVKRLPRSVSRDDIEQAGMIGLWKALKKPQPPEQDPGKFEGYVRARIRGAILDELRTQDWLPRRRGSSLGEHVELVRFEDIQGSHGWQERFGNGDASAEDALIVKREAAAALTAPLNDTNRRVIELVVFGGNRHTDVADELGVSEARISQRYAQAINMMHRHLTDDDHDPVSYRELSRRRRTP